MKLYTYPGAPNPRRVDILLHEKKIDVPAVVMDITKGENRRPEFIEKVNVMGGLPVLELDDGTHIAESIAICRYFESLHPEPSLFGRTPREQAGIEMWLRRIEFNFMMPVGMVWVHGSPLTASVIKEQIPAVAEQNRKVVGRYFSFLDEQLAKRSFIAGEEYSIADITALCTFDFAGALNQLHPPPEHRHLFGWHERVSNRASAIASLGGTRQ